MSAAYRQTIARLSREAVAITEDPQATDSQIKLAYRFLREHRSELINAPFPSERPKMSLAS